MKVINSEKIGTNVFHYYFGFNLRDIRLEVEIQHYSGNNIPDQKRLCLHYLFDLLEEVLYHEHFPI